MIAKLSPLKVLWQSFLAIAIFWLLVYVLVPNGGLPLATLIASYFSALLAVIFLLYMLQINGVITRRLLVLATALFTLRVLVGVFHYIIFMDGDYFASEAPTLSALFEYEWLNNSMIIVSQYWTKQGFNSLPVEFLLATKNTFLMPYFALLYYLGGNEHFLNVTILNSFHALLVAVLVTGLASSISSQKITHAVFVIALLQPFGFISSIMWRDSVGQFFLIAGGIMIIPTQGRIRDLVNPILGSLLMMLLRNIYVIVGFFIIIGGLFVSNRRTIIPILIGLALLGYSIYNYIFPLFLYFYDFQYDGFAYNQNFLSLPHRIMTGLSGPFPWTQFLDPATPGREYQPADILQAIFNLTTVSLVVSAILKRKIAWREPRIATLLIFVFTISFVGILSHGHVSYVTVATVLLLPVIPKLTVYSFFGVAFLFLVISFTTGLVWQLIR